MFVTSLAYTEQKLTALALPHCGPPLPGGDKEKYLQTHPLVWVRAPQTENHCPNNPPTGQVPSPEVWDLLGVAQLVEK